MSRLSRIFLSFALVLGLCSTALADSFLTSVRTQSKTAARVGPAPYRGGMMGDKAAMRVARRGLSMIKNVRNVAIGLDVVQRVDSATMDSPKAANYFRLGLAKLARTTNDPKIQVLRGANLVRQRPGSDWAISKVRKALKAMPNNSAAQLVAGLAVAQRDGFAAKFGHNWDNATPLKREAAKHINRAQTLEAKTAHARPLVREGLKQAKAYVNYYDGFKGMIK